MKYYFYIDETGDHWLTTINEDFPYFLLCGILLREDQADIMNHEIKALKQKYFWTDAVILHSRDIRKCNGPFQILFDLEVKKNFYSDLNTTIYKTPFIIISAAIKKEDYLKRYGVTAHNPYQVTLSYILERLVFCVDGLDRNWAVQILIEKRGKNEDRDLLQHYNRVVDSWTFYVTSDRFQNRIQWFDFRGKKENDSGIQLADLCAYPVVSSIRNPNIPNPAFELLKPKIYCHESKLYGLKIFP